MLLPLPMLVPAPLPALTGSLCAAGLVLLGWWWLWPGPALVSRIAPYLGGARPRLPHRIIRMVLRGAEKFGSTHASVTGRLHRLGEGDVADFRFAQLRAGVLAGAAGIALGLACLARGLPAALAAACPVLFLIGAILAVDSQLTARLRRRDSAITAELPDIAHLLSIAVGAGTSIVGAIEYVASFAGGALGKELRRTLGDVYAGDPLTTALRRLNERVHNPALQSLCEALLAALAHGSPLADTLRVQAEEARDYARRQLLERGGRREILMMIPVVFLILPFIVVIALYPGLARLTFLPLNSP
ncbi:type II secretion system F family protein [Actinotignum sp. GS-2025b]|uniref:type II secretion system F family protein n=1 Tax=Actinotignum sp. GS-2025b TaxID=3427275 RepID=UPI003F4781BF